MNEFVLLDAAIWRDFREFDALMRIANATPLYADLPSLNAKQLGPWLLDADTFCACVPADEPRALPWRFGLSRLSTEESWASLAKHLESQRGVAMADGDRYYLRYADTRALDGLERALTDEQKQQLKGPIAHWHYVDRFGQEREFGAGLSADLRRHAEIVLSAEQSDRLLEQELAGTLAEYLETGREGSDQCRLSAVQYGHVEASVAFLLRHGIEPLDVQRHVAAVAVGTDGAVFTDAGFLARIDSLRVSQRWHELMTWRGDSINSGA
jgi:hypothetical protein